MLRLLEAEDTTGVGVWYSWQVEIRKSIEQRDRDRGLDLATSKPQVFDVAWRPGVLPTQPNHSGQQIQRSSQAHPSTEAGVSRSHRAWWSCSCNTALEVPIEGGIRYGRWRFRIVVFCVGSALIR